MKKIFIYYSLTGNGDTVADYLKDKDIEIRKVEAIDKMPKSFLGRILVGGFLAFIHYEAKLIDFNNNIDEYDEIIIGSPIWNDRLSCPINTVLKSLNLENKKVKFILYSGSGKSKHASARIKDILVKSEIINIKEPLKNKEILKDKLDFL